MLVGRLFGTGRQSFFSNMARAFNKFPDNGALCPDLSTLTGDELFTWDMILFSSISKPRLTAELPSFSGFPFCPFVLFFPGMIRVVSGTIHGGTFLSIALGVLIELMFSCGTYGTSLGDETNFRSVAHGITLEFLSVIPSFVSRTALNDGESSR